MCSKTATDVSLSFFLILFFIHSAASQCQGGRSVGPVPSVTDDRYEMRSCGLLGKYLLVVASETFRPFNGHFQVRQKNKITCII